MAFLAHGERFHNLLQLLQHGVGRGREGFSVVVDTLQVTGVACQHEGNKNQVVHIEMASGILLDGLAKAYGQFLTGVHGNALRRVGHEGIGQSAIDECANKLIRIDDTRVCNDRHGLDVSNFLDEWADVFVVHLGGYQRIVEHATIERHGRVEGIQAGRYFHCLYLVDGFSRGVDNTSLVEWWTSVGVMVLDNKVLCLLGVDKRGGKRVLLGLDILVVLEAVGGQHFLHLGMGAGCYLVDHRPWEANGLLILQVVDKRLRHQTLFGPSFCVGHDAGFHFVAVVRAVVHALHRQWQLSGFEPLVEQGGHLSHGS